MPGAPARGHTANCVASGHGSRRVGSWGVGQPRSRRQLPKRSRRTGAERGPVVRSRGHAIVQALRTPAAPPRHRPPRAGNTRGVTAAGPIPGRTAHQRHRRGLGRISAKACAPPPPTAGRECHRIAGPRGKQVSADIDFDLVLHPVEEEVLTECSRIRRTHGAGNSMSSVTYLARSSTCWATQSST